MTPITLKIPGKLFIAGEYAVTQPGAQALVTSVTTHFSVSIGASMGMSCLRSPEVEDLNFDITASISNFSEDWKFALSALEKTFSITNFRPREQVILSIASDLGFGEHKKGYGSSSAVVVGVVKALDLYFQLHLNQSQIFQIALQAHLEAQGSGSGGDVAAVTYGGMIHYQSIGQKIEKVTFPWDMYVARTGESVKTHEKLDLQFSENFYQQSDALVERLAGTQDFSSFKSLLQANQSLLVENLPEGYLTDKLGLALDLINGHPLLAGKISGAGFGENIIVFDAGVAGAGLQMMTQTLANAGILFEKIKPEKSLL